METSNNKKLEEEFVRMGFEYKRMAETALHINGNHALFIDTIRLKYNLAQKYQDEIHIQFSVGCITKGQPSHIQDMSVTLKRYRGHQYEGQELYYNYYHPDKAPFPTKDQVMAEIQGILKRQEIKERFSIGENKADSHQHLQNMAKVNRGL
jgi:hypothetical protein